MSALLLCTEIRFSRLQHYFLFLMVLGIVFGSPTRSVAQGNWPMPGHDAQRTGRANFAGPTTAPTAPAWVFLTAGPIVGDIVTSAEGKLYLASDKLYALNPDGTSFVPAVAIGSAVTGPVVDDIAGLVYVAVSAADGGFDLLSLTKQLQGAAVLFHVPRPPFGGAISPLLLGRGGTVYFVAGRFPGVVYAAGAVQWSNPVCEGESGQNTPFGVSENGPALFNDGSSLVVMCGTPGTSGDLFKLDPFTGVKIASASGGERNLTEPAIDSLNHIHSGWQAFGGAIFCGDYLTWDFSLTLLTPQATFCDSSRFATSRAAVFPDGTSTVRIGFAFPPNNVLVADGAHAWASGTDGSTIPNFSSVPAVDAAGNVFIGNTQGIEALSSVDGHTLWSFSTGDAITTQPVVANGGVLYVGSSSGNVYAFNAVPAAQSGTVYVSGSGAGFATVDLQSASVVANNNSFTDGGVIRVSPDGTRSYVSAIFGLAVVDNATNQVITTVSVGSRPAWIALSPDGSRIYVSQPNISSAPGVAQGVYVIDASTNAVIAIIPVPGPQRIAVAPDNSRIYVGSNGRGIAVIDPATNAITGSISIPGANLTGIAFTPDSAHAYVGEFLGTLYLIDARADSVLQTIPLTGSVGGGIGDVVVNPDGHKVYVGINRTSPSDPGHNIFVIDTATKSVIGQIPVSFPSPEMSITTDGANLLVGNSDIGELVVASIATDSIVETIHMDGPVISGIGAKPPATAVSAPQLSAPSSVDFGTVILGAQSTSNIQLVNSGRSPVTITALAISDPNFTIVNSPLIPITIAPGASTELSISFAPTSRRIFTAGLSISVLGLPSPVTVTLNGNAILPPFLRVLPPALDFGTVSMAETKQLQVQIQNIGEAPLVGSVALLGSNAFTIADPTDFSVSGGQSAFITLNFAPRARAPFSGTFTVTSNAGVATIPVLGQGERVAVVLVHGFTGDPTTFGAMDSLLQRTASLEVFSFNYSSDTSLFKGLPIEKIAGNLAQFIGTLTTHGIDRVDVVAHSMGGLVTRAYIADMAIQNGTPVPYAGNIRKLITIGTPNYGVAPRLLTRLDAFAQNKQVQEMLFSSDFILQLNRNWADSVVGGFTPRIKKEDVFTIVGTQTPDGSVFPYGVDDDGLVAGPSATLECSFASCDVPSANQNLRYVPYQHANIVKAGIDLLGNNPAEAFVPFGDTDFQTFRLVREFLLEEPLEVTFIPPAQFTGNGLMMLELVDGDSGKPIRIFDALTSVAVDGSAVDVSINGKAGVITIWPVTAQEHTFTVTLSSFVYPDPAPLTVKVPGERPTKITLFLHRTHLF
jgi:YVTN family beta-propeller protein